MRWIVYIWAFPTTIIGLIVTIAALLTGGQARVVDGVLEVCGGAATFWLKRVAGLTLKGGASAMTLGHVVLGRDAELLDVTRRHERVHVRQCERWGPLFLPAYFIASLIAVLRGGRAYEDNGFEKEAFRLAD